MNGDKRRDYTARHTSGACGGAAREMRTDEGADACFPAVMCLLFIPTYCTFNYSEKEAEEEKKTGLYFNM